MSTKFMCKAKIQTGSINGKPFMTWVDFLVTKKLSNGVYVAQTVDLEHLYYLTSDEIYINLKILKNTIDEIL